MILYVNQSGKIYGSNDCLTPEKEDLEIKKDFAVKYDGVFSWDMGEEKDGCKKEFYLEDNGKIRVEYVDISASSKPALTQADRIEAAVDYLMATRG